MASLTPKTLYVGNGTGTGANIYTVGSTAGNYTIVKSINICNANTTTVRTVVLNIVPPSGSAASNNLYISNMAIVSNDSLQIDSTLILSNGYSIYANTNVDVIITISGVEYA